MKMNQITIWKENVKLYQWLMSKRFLPILEYYDREIQQRPDIMFMYNGRKYALEYQCSTISERNIYQADEFILAEWVHSNMDSC